MLISGRRRADLEAKPRPRPLLRCRRTTEIPSPRLDHQHASATSLRTAETFEDQLAAIEGEHRRRLCRGGGGGQGHEVKETAQGLVRPSAVSKPILQPTMGSSPQMQS